MDAFIEKIQKRKIGSKYSLVRKIGEGGHAAVYLGRDFDTGEEVALKLEHREIEPSILQVEAHNYTAFAELPGFPTIHWHGEQDDYLILELQLLGPSLEDLFAYCEFRFSLKTALMILDQLFTRLEAVHSCGLIHRDIKPNNFLLGTGKSSSMIYIADFGIAREYEDAPEKYQEVPPRRPWLLGTAEFASIRAQLDQSLSPRDDLESLGYMMVYLLQGRLPWGGIKAMGHELDDLILKKKQETSVKVLCDGLPEEFAKFMCYAKSLDGGRMPDYAMLRKSFRELAKWEKHEYDDIYDWTIRLYFSSRSLRK